MARTAFAEALENLKEAELYVRKYNKDLWPKLNITSINSVKMVSAVAAPDDALKLLTETLASAEKTIDLYIYDLTSELLKSQLLAAKERGVVIRIMYDTTDFQSGIEALKQKILDELDVTTKEAPSAKDCGAFSICHQKFAVIDDRQVFIGSGNWGNNSFAVERPKWVGGHRDWYVCITNDEVAKFFSGLFQADWDIPREAEALTADIYDVKPQLEAIMVPMAVEAPPTIFALADFQFDSPITVTPVISPDNYFDFVSAQLNSAKRSIQIELQYLYEQDKPTALLELISRKKSDGLTVQIVTSIAFENSWDKSKSALSQTGLLDNTRVLNMKFFSHCHNKGIIIDSEKVLVASTNWSDTSITQNREAGVFIESKDVAEYFGKVFAMDWDTGSTPDNAQMLVESLYLSAMQKPGSFTKICAADYLN